MVQHIKQFDNINFNGGNISSDGGALLILTYVENKYLPDILKELEFDDCRRKPKHSNESITKQMIYKKVLGYFNQKDQEVLKNDPFLSQYLSACSQPTVSRFYDRITEKVNRAFKEKLMTMACDYVNANLKDIVLDVDSTKVETHGKQEGSSFIYHYATKGYHPFVINEFTTKLLLYSELRSGNSYSSNGFMNALKELLAHLEKRSIKLRADSAFYNHEYLDFMDKEGITYYVRAKNYEKVHDKILEKLDSEGIDYHFFSSQEPHYGEMPYKLAQMESECRYIYKVYPAHDKEQLSLIPCIYCIITNDMTSSCQEICNFYEKRGNSENFTKELKDDFDAGSAPHYDFEKNCLEFMLSSIAYNLYHLFRLDVLEGDDLKIRMNTFRQKYQKVAVKVIRHARKITLSFTSAYPHQEKFMKYYDRILDILSREAVMA